jgi:uncharacterized membrane protein YbhN (UPF0104 family)
MFGRKKKKSWEDYYRKKEANKRTLCRDAYEMGKSGICTASLGAICLGSSIGFGFGTYAILDRFIRNDSRLTDSAVTLTILLGVSAVTSGIGARLMYGVVGNEYNLLKEHYNEYRNGKLFKS